MEGDSFGNSVFNIKPVSKEDFPLFGAKYDFHLEGVVDCPEFLVHLPTMEKWVIVWFCFCMLGPWEIKFLELL